MERVYFAMPDGICERMQATWGQRPALPPGMTYNFAGQRGAFCVGLPADLEGTVVGTASFGAKGSDIDLGVLGVQVEGLVGKRTYEIIYPRQGLVVVSEVRVMGELEFRALPAWRLKHDAAQYARAASIIEATCGLDAWLRLKKLDKVGAYNMVGITCQQLDGSYHM